MINKKSICIVVVIALIAMLAVAVVFSFHQEEQKKIEKTNHEFAVENTRVFNLGETVVLNAAEDEKGFDYGGYVAGFPWRGTVEMTVVSAKVFSSFKNAGLDIEKRIDRGRTQENAKLLVLEVDLYNNDAKSLMEEKDRFNISTFVNLLEKNSPSSAGDIVYFDGTASGVQPRKGEFEFILKDGEKKTFLVGIEVPAHKLNESLVIGMGSAYNKKYAVELALGEGA